MPNKLVVIFSFVFLVITPVYAPLLGQTNSVLADSNNVTKSQFELDAQLEKAIDDLDPNGVKAAIANGANPNYVFGNLQYGRSAINHVASLGTTKIGCREQDCLQILNVLFDNRAKLQTCDNSILFMPIADGFPNIVELLINKGASPKAQIERMTPVEWAEAYGQKNVVEVLLKYGAKPISKEQAAQNRFVECAANAFEDNAIPEMEKALRNGASVNGADSRGNLALVNAISCAYKKEDYSMVCYLLKKGANPNLKAEWQHYRELASIPLHHAILFHGIMVKNGEDKVIYQRLIIKDLLDAGAHVSSRGYNGMSPLHIAAKNNDSYIANVLIEAGAKIMDKDDSGKTPLDYAESAEMIKLLKSHGAKEI
jgi:ankyrin repeat protein